MLFTEQFKIKKESAEDWFDPILDHDTKLFIDPFLIFQSKDSRFAEAHKKTIDYFNDVFTLIAQSAGNTDSAHYKKALNILLFPEVREICLGYASSTTKGSGSSSGFSGVIAEAIWISIQSGIKKIEHFEELSIFNEGIGADRISDMTANLLKEDLIAYTLEVCQRHNIPTKEKRLRNTSFSFELKVWNSEKVRLPINPMTGDAVILVPSKFIRPLPTINPEDFWDYMCSRENEIIRSNFSYLIKGKVSKTDIVGIARAHLGSVEKYVKFREERGSNAYDLEKDPENYYRWYSVGKDVASKNPLNVPLPTNAEEVIVVVDKIVGNFKHFIEQQRGYELLWVKGRPRSEGAVQRIFMGISSSYCEAYDIDPSKEENLGSGPVDFKFSKGFSKRVLLEVKLARNSKFWEGLHAQLPQYMLTEKIKDGIFLVIVYNAIDIRRYGQLASTIDKANKEHGVNMRCTLIDARPKRSASKLPITYALDAQLAPLDIDLPVIDLELPELEELKIEDPLDLKLDPIK